MTITEKGLQAIGRGDAPSPAKAPVQEQTPGIHVSGPMPPETFKLNPEDLERLAVEPGDGWQRSD
jgi:hypothetical protein